MSILLFSILTGIVILFQAGLAIGMPWGAASMGGKFPGKYPPKMRIVALINIALLLGMMLIVFTKVGILFPELLPVAEKAIWGVVVFFLAGTILNILTPSKIERIWTPVALGAFVCSLIIALE